MVALIAVSAVPALATTTATTTTGATAGPVLVARCTFDGGAPAGRVADTSGRGAPLTVRAAVRVRRRAGSLRSRPSRSFLAAAEGVRAAA